MNEIKSQDVLVQLLRHLRVCAFRQLQRRDDPLERVQRRCDVGRALRHGEGDAAVGVGRVHDDDAEGGRQQRELLLNTELQRQLRGEDRVLNEQGFGEYVIRVSGEEGARCLRLDARVEPDHGLGGGGVGEGGVEGEAEFGGRRQRFGEKRGIGNEELGEADEGLVLGKDDLRREVGEELGGVEVGAEDAGEVGRGHGVAIRVASDEGEEGEDVVVGGEVVGGKVVDQVLPDGGQRIRG